MSQFVVAEPVLKSISVRGVTLAVWEWPGTDPPLVFAHATGFHGRCWDAVIRRLPGRRTIAVDLRGHGRSGKPEPPYPWRTFGEDVADVCRTLDVHSAIGIGHSMGGHSIVTSALLRPETYSSLFLIDPTIFAPERYGRPARDASFIQRRRRFWKSAEEMFQTLRARPPFDQWQPEVVRDYCEYGLLPAGDEFELACPPMVEASIYPLSVAAESDLTGELKNVKQPVVVIRGGIPWNPERYDFTASPTTPDLASRFPDGRDVMLKGRSHFIPMEIPEWVAQEITSDQRDPAGALALP